MAATSGTPAKPAPEKLDPALVKTALILVVGGLAVVFDTTIVSRAKPASTSSAHAASSRAASSSSPRRRCRVRWACSVITASIAAQGELREACIP